MCSLRSLIALFLLAACGHLHAQRAVVPAGGEATGAGGSLSWTLGQVDALSITSTGGSVQQGVQQPYEWLSVDVPENEAALGVSAMPNPANDGITIQLAGRDGITAYRLLDTDGRLISSGSFSGDRTFIPLSGRPTGTYLIHLQRSGEQATLRVIKQ